jgi:glucose 1-dehydrogenase
MLRRASVLVPVLGAGVLGNKGWSHCEDKKLVLPGLQGKVAIVSAAAQGIGRGICLSLAEQGAIVICVDLPNQKDNAAETVRLVRECGSDGIYVAADATSREQVEAAFGSAIEVYGHIDVSVSVVGGGKRGPLLDEKTEDYEQTVALTQHSHFHWQQIAARHMCGPEPFEASLESGGKSMVLVGSIMSQMNVEGCLPYQACKAAVRSMGLSLAHEMGQHGIRVNVLQPGYIDTPGLELGKLKVWSEVMTLMEVVCCFP